MSRRNMFFGLLLGLVLAAAGAPASRCHAADCNNNGVLDESEGDFDADGVIDGCDECGLQLTDNDLYDSFGLRAKTTSQGRVLWADQDSSVQFYDGDQTELIQAKDDNDPTLDDIELTVFTLGSGANPGEVLGGWRRGTDFGWVWQNDGRPPVLIQYSSPYQDGDPMNPQAVVADSGCLFMLFRAFDPDAVQNINHAFKIDPASGEAELLTGDFLGDTTTGGTGAFASNLVTSGCKAAWAWCHSGENDVCDENGIELHYYDGATVSVIDDNAIPTGFAMGRLVYLRPIGGIQQVFLYDTNLDNPVPVQLTNFGSAEKNAIFAQTDGYHVAILRGDANEQNRDIITLGGFALTDADTRPSDQPNNLFVPIQVDRGQLFWETNQGSFMAFDGRVSDTVCSQGWLADGFVAMSRKTDNTGDDTEIFLKQLSLPADPSRPAAPWIVTAEATANGEITLAWEPLLGVTSYNVYLAREPGVTKDNFAALIGGRHLSAEDSNSMVIDNLPGSTDWYFVVAAVAGDEEGPVSAEATATPCVDETLDRDADGIADCLDNCLDAANAGQADADADGLGDDCDPNPGQPGVNECCGGGVPALMPMMLAMWIIQRRGRSRNRFRSFTNRA